MTLDLTGIYNDNEFYTTHYVSAILGDDLKGRFTEWNRLEKEQGRTAPPKLLKKLAPRFFRLRAAAKGQAGGARSAESSEDHTEREKELADFQYELLTALGHPWAPDRRYTDDGREIPILGEIAKASGAPELWIMPAVPGPGDAEEADPLEYRLNGDNGDEPETLVRFVNRAVFSRNEPPRWLVLFAPTQILLLDRSKWSESRRLRFDLEEILARKEDSTLAAMAALLHRDSICPEDGFSLLDNLDENSHKHAHAVSEDLKYALRECIELLGNDAVAYLRHQRKKGVFSGEEELDEEQLSLECLRWMYRLLFLFFIEARPELGYVPMNADAYRKGYSLESLRELELMPLSSAEAREGTYIHESLQILFDMIHEGFPALGKPEERRASLPTGTEDIIHHTFTITALRSHLFDPQRTPLLNKVRFSNAALQRIIELMSLSRPKGKNTRRGRISYAQLGINQLGAVYEALLSYRGFFAKEDLYEVKPEKEDWDPLEPAFFVSAKELPEYSDKEKVFYTERDGEDLKGKLRMHPKGSFVYRLAGRDRQKSASYYTPESLTRCLVRYALRELLKDKSADEILDITVCEPAMGSAAFLNEAVNQLADAYMTAKQKELDETLPVDRLVAEKQRVKMYLADNRVFGVDMNPVAVELAEVSLWLNTILEGGFVPWFGNQLICGDSLIGARRQVMSISLQKKAKKVLYSLDTTIHTVPFGKGRSQGQVWHFLLPDPGMAKYEQREIKQQVAPEACCKAREWRNNFCSKTFSPEEVSLLDQLSQAVDALWEERVKRQAELRRRTTDPLAVYGHDCDETAQTSTEIKDRILRREQLAEEQRYSTPYRRLKLAMDYWCALWFWPLEHVDLLPDRQAFLWELSLILKGEVLETETTPTDDTGNIYLPGMSPKKEPEQLPLPLDPALGRVKVETLIQKLPRLGMVDEIARRRRFMHWELEFADIIAERGGFDLVLGNPPWIKVEWNEGGILGDHEPRFVLRKFSASKLAQLRGKLLQDEALRRAYLAEYEEAEGVQNYLSAAQNYPELRGVQTNLFKCFLPQAWRLERPGGVSGFLHPEGVYDDSHGGELRESVYARLRYHFQFQNQHMLFPIGHRNKYGVSIYGAQVDEIAFSSIANLFTPATVDACFKHDGRGPVPGIKNEEGKFDTTGHSQRIIHVNRERLALFARLYDVEGTAAERARLPALHSEELVDVLRKFAAQPRRLGDLEDQYLSLEMWHETNAQKDGTIRRETRFPDHAVSWVLSGPHFYVGCPLYKTPRRICTEKGHYDILDLQTLPDDYLPRTNYLPACDEEEYLRRTPKVPWDGRPVTEFYRLVFRRAFGTSSERSLIPSIAPLFTAHIHPVLSLTFKNLRTYP